MKRKFIITELAALCLVFAALTSCNKNQFPSDDLSQGLDPSSGAPIAFSTEDAFTKAAGETDEEALLAVRAGGFCVWSWFQGTTAGHMFGENGTLVQDKNYDPALQPEEQNPTQNWTYSPLRYWLNGTYDFAAVYPSTVAGKYAPANPGDAPTLTVTDYDVTKDDDILVAFMNDVAGDDGKTPHDPVYFSFKHALSCVQLQLKLNKESFYQTLDGVESKIADAYVTTAGFNDIYMKASLTSSETTDGDIVLSWDDHSNRNSFGESFENSTPVGNDFKDVFSGKGIHVMPQSLEDGVGEFYLQVRIKFVSGEEFHNDFTIPLNKGVQEWLPNTRYIYKGEITQNSAINFTVIRVNGWDENTLDDFNDFTDATN